MKDTTMDFMFIKWLQLKQGSEICYFSHRWREIRQELGKVKMGKQTTMTKVNTETLYKNTNDSGTVLAKAEAWLHNKCSCTVKEFLVDHVTKSCTVTWRHVEARGIWRSIGHSESVPFFGGLTWEEWKVLHEAWWPWWPVWYYSEILFFAYPSFLGEHRINHDMVPLE